MGKCCLNEQNHLIRAMAGHGFNLICEANKKLFGKIVGNRLELLKIIGIALILHTQTVARKAPERGYCPPLL